MGAVRNGLPDLWFSPAVFLTRGGTLRSAGSVEVRGQNPLGTLTCVTAKIRRIDPRES